MLQQTIHGYSDGHRLLASSTELKGRDAQSMVILSDTRGQIDSTTPSYLTGYPLTESGLYVLARTWPATEMARPGCVWTHSLLIDFADLALLQPHSLLSLFRRPGEGSVLADFRLKLAIPEPESELAPDESLLTRIVSSLYGRPEYRVITTDGAPRDREIAVLAIWAQQWPKLRRSFRFCTFAIEDRSTDNIGFDLQFGGRDRPKAQAVTQPPSDVDAWVAAAVRDASKPGPLRAFLRTVGTESGGGREAFAPLSAVHVFLEEGASKSVVDALDAVAAWPSTLLTRTVTARLAQAVLAHANELPLDALHRAVHTFTAWFSMSEWSQLASVYWSRVPDWNAGELSEWQKEALVDAVTVNTLVQAFNARRDLVPLALSRRADFTEDPRVWSIPEVYMTLALQIAKLPPSSLTALFENVAQTHRGKLIRQLGAGPIIDAIIRRIGVSRGALSPNEVSWVVETNDPGAIARLLSSAPHWEGASLERLAQRIRPDFVPNDYGDDPWMTALRRSYPESEPSSWLNAWRIARALSRRSREPIGLLRGALGQTYSLLARSMLNDGAWSILQPTLPDATWGEWDRCKRLRTAIIRLAVDVPLPQIDLARVLGVDILPEFVRESTNVIWGRGYFKKMRGPLRSSSDPSDWRLAEAIDSAL